MPKFRVNEVTTYIHVYEVEAESEYEAEQDILMERENAKRLPEFDDCVDRRFEFEKIK